MRPGRLAVALWGALVALGCTGPNPAYRLRVEVGSGGSGGSGGGGGGGGGGTAGVRADGLLAPDAGGSGGGTSDAQQPDPDTSSPPADAPLPPPDLAADMTPPPDMTPPQDMTVNPPVDAPPAVNVDDRLRAHWEFNEPMGTTQIADPIGNNTGTLQNGASLVASGIPNAGSGNRAARFQGNDDHMTITIRSLPTLQVAKSIALWINPDALSHSGMRTILAMATSNDSSGIQIGTDLGRPAIWRWGTSSGTAPVKYNGNWIDRWYHMVYTYENQRHTLYVDGAMVGSVMNLPVTGTVGNAVLGCYDPDQLGWEMYEGLLDDVRVYDKVLSQAEIDRLQLGEQ